MTRYEKWRLFTKNLPAPDSFIDFGYYYLISCCLQRRVWYYGDAENEEGKLFPNLYIVMVGPPGCGKGIVLSKVAALLKHHKYEKGSLIKTSMGEEKPPLFPIGADSLTFEELLDDIALSTRALITPDKRPYVYTSYAFILQELDSLFRKKTDDVVRFLKNSFDCGDYDRKTRHQGKTLLRRLCCSLIAGTQLDFIREALEAKIFGQGFASRALFLFENEERFSSFHISDLSEEQKCARDDLLEWIKRLSLVYGEIKYDQATREWLDDWYQNVFILQRKRASNRMQDYMARKKVIMLKLAAAIHYSEDLSMTIPLSAFQKAIELLSSVEHGMEVGFNMSGRNQLHTMGRRILSYIRSRGKTKRKELIIEFGADMSLEEIETCLEELVIGYGLKSGQNDNEKIYYI